MHPLRRFDTQCVLCADILILHRVWTKAGLAGQTLCSVSMQILLEIGFFGTYTKVLTDGEKANYVSIAYLLGAGPSLLICTFRGGRSKRPAEVVKRIT